MSTAPAEPFRPTRRRGAGRSIRSSSAAAPGRAGAHADLADAGGDAVEQRRRRPSSGTQVDLGPAPDVGAAAHRRDGHLVVDERGQQPVVRAEQPALRAHRADVARPGAAAAPARRRGRARRARRGRLAGAVARGHAEGLVGQRPSRHWAGVDGSAVQLERDARRGQPVVGRCRAVRSRSPREARLQPEHAGEAREVRQSGAARSAERAWAGRVAVSVTLCRMPLRRPPNHSRGRRALTTLPMSLRGSASVNRICRGRLCGASSVRDVVDQLALRGRLSPAGTTWATIRSPRSSSGTPITAASATPACSSSAFSISPAPIL